MKNSKKSILVLCCFSVLCLGILNAKPVWASNTEILFDSVENLYSQYFPPTQPTQTILSFTYRFYPSTGVYLGINSEDNGVYLLGGTFGDSLVFVGSVEEVETMLGITEPELPIGYLVQGGLIWKPNATPNEPTEKQHYMTWSEAYSYCKFNEFNGQTGWRLPTINELENFARSDALIGQGWQKGWRYEFANWSKTSVPNHSDKHFVYDWSLGTKMLNDTYHRYVSCVRPATEDSGTENNGSLYMLEYESTEPIAQFYLIEPSTAQVLAAGETIDENCLLTGPEDFSRLAGSPDQPFLLDVTNTSAGQKIRIFSEYANQPLLRLVTCGDLTKEYKVYLDAPVEVTGCALDDISGCTPVGPVANPYKDCSLVYAGSVSVSITGDEGTHAEFQSNILDTLKSSDLWEAKDIDVSSYSFPSGQNDFTVYLLIKTELCVDDVAGEFPGNPTVITASGRFVQLHYNKLPW